MAQRHQLKHDNHHTESYKPTREDAARFFIRLVIAKRAEKVAYEL